MPCLHACESPCPPSVRLRKDVSSTDYIAKKPAAATSGNRICQEMLISEAARPSTTGGASVGIDLLVEVEKVEVEVGDETIVTFELVVDAAKSSSCSEPGAIVMMTAGALKVAVIVSPQIDFVQRLGCCCCARQRTVIARMRAISLRPGFIEACKPDSAAMLDPRECLESHNHRYACLDGSEIPSYLYCRPCEMSCPRFDLFPSGSSGSRTTPSLRRKRCDNPDPFVESVLASSRPKIVGSCHFPSMNAV